MSPNSPKEDVLLRIFRLEKSHKGLSALVVEDEIVEGTLPFIGTENGEVVFVGHVARPIHFLHIILSGRGRPRLPTLFDVKRRAQKNRERQEGSEYLGLGST